MKQWTDMQTCNHSWTLVWDCEGDPDVAHGMHHFQYLICLLCGTESHDHREIELHKHTSESYYYLDDLEN